MEMPVERGEGSHGERARKEESMASRRITEDGGLPGPWLASPGEGSSLWGWSGDEETLPLIEPKEEGGEELVLEKVVPGPWTFEDSNPFVGNMWTLRSGLRPQETLEPVPKDVPVNVEVLINTDKVEMLKPSRTLLEVADPPNIEPSHTALLNSASTAEFQP